jgi:hypothetical protein
MATVKRYIAQPDGANAITFSVDHGLYGEIKLLAVSTAGAKRTPRQIIYLRQA